MNPLTYDVRDRLVSQGVGTYGTNIFIGAKAVIPAGAGPYLSLISTGGSRGAGTHNDTATERPSLQLVARAISHAAAYNMLLSAYDAMGGANGLFNVWLSGTFYLSITARQHFAEIGEDESGRPMISYNLDTERQYVGP